MNDETFVLSELSITEWTDREWHPVGFTQGLDFRLLFEPSQRSGIVLWGCVR